MKFLILTHVAHIQKDGDFYAYAPYIKEMNLWVNHIDELSIVAPLSNDVITKIDEKYNCKNISFSEIPSFSLTSFKNILLSVVKVPKILAVLFKAMKQADHIHLRCPGNIGLLGCFVQIFFPNKPKTAKYAGNWDPNSKQPWSYRLQKWILSNTFLTKNMSVLVYGQWEGSTKNIVPFFTATYKESDKSDIAERTLDQAVRFLFVGTLSKGKQPLYAVQLVESILDKGIDARLDIFGEGAERAALEEYITRKNLADSITLHGNQTAHQIEIVYKTSHFLVLPSQSEGWPKVVAEAMFWGCVPVSTKVSCVPFMVGEGSRGILLSQELSTDVSQIVNLIKQPLRYKEMAGKGMLWSREFTLDKFEKAISDLLKR